MHKKYILTNVVSRECNKFPPSLVQCSTMDSFKNQLGRHFLQLDITKVEMQSLGGIKFITISLKFKKRPPSLDHGVCGLNIFAKLG